MTRRFTPLVNLLAFSCSGHALQSPFLRTSAFASLSGRSAAAVSSGNSCLGGFQQRLGRRRTLITASPAPAGANAPITGLESLTTSAPATAAMSAMSASGADDSLPYRYRWPRPSVTVDCLIYALDEGAPWILLIKRKNDPFKGGWALPGGFVDENEGLDVAARRELEEETGVTDCAMVQTGAYGDPGRDPRGHTITVAFMAWAPSRAACNARAGDDAAEACFFPVERLPTMAFDHLKVITDSWARCRFGATTTTTGSSSSGDGDGDGAVKGVTVEDRASGRTLAEYSQASGGALDADALGSLLPTEAAEGSA